MKENKLRKPLYGEALINYSLKLRRDQITQLKKLDNAAELVREWIDEKLAEVLKEGPDAFSLLKKKSFLEKQINQLCNSPEYARARSIQKLGLEYFADVASALDLEGFTLRFSSRYNYGQLIAHLGDKRKKLLDGYEKVYAPGWNAKTLAQYLDANKVPEVDDYQDIPIEHARVIINKMLEAYPVEVKVVESYEKEIAKLEAECERLRLKIAEQPTDK